MKHTEFDDGGRGGGEEGGRRGRSEGEGELCEGIRAPKGGILTVLSFLLIHFFNMFQGCAAFFSKSCF